MFKIKCLIKCLKKEWFFSKYHYYVTILFRYNLCRVGEKNGHIQLRIKNYLFNSFETPTGK